MGNDIRIGNGESRSKLTVDAYNLYISHGGRRLRPPRCTAAGDLGAQLVKGADNLSWKYYGSVGNEWSTSLAAL